MAYRVRDYLRCPSCGKKGVTMRLSREDGWGCRYCDWWAYTSGEDTADVRERGNLAKANPEREIWVSDLPESL